MKAMRNIVAHSYGTVDPETTWEIICDDIPRLKTIALRS
nr:HepT-like ribonuclease domain-containing protein [uncultured Oscillibacter sp.]